MGVSITISGSGQVDVQDGAAPSVQLSQSPVGGANLIMSSGASVSFVNNNPSAVAVSGTQAVAVAVNAPTAQSAMINSSLSIGYVDGKWGDLTGTITNQTDLVNYITSRLPDVPFETIQEILDALNDLESIDFTAPVKIFGTNTAGDPISFTIPAPLEQFESGTPYVMVVAPDGTVQWREIGLEYISGTNNLTLGGGTV